MLNMMSASSGPQGPQSSERGQDCLGSPLGGGGAFSHHQRRIPGLVRCFWVKVLVPSLMA